jgi:regulator of RNase E activity RraB
MRGKQVLPFHEGDWVAIPLPKGGYAAALIARVRPKRRYSRFLAYCFTPRYPTPPTLSALLSLRPHDAFYIQIVELKRPEDQDALNQFQVIGRCPRWNPKEWPIPPFLELIGSKPHPYLEYYSEKDLETVVAREAQPVEALRGRWFTWETGLGVAHFVKEVDRLIDAPPVDEEWLAEWHERREEHWQFVQWVRERIAQERQQAQEPEVDELLQDPTRVALLRAYAAGVDPAVPYWVEHFLYFPRRRWAEQVARRLRQLGYEVEVSESATEGLWLVLARCQMLPTEEDIDAVAEQLRELAEAFGGEYDGWGMDVRQ